MFNVRICGIISGSAFVISFLIGLVSRSSMPMLILRPVIFAVLFFGLSVLIHMIIVRFLPELMDAGDPSAEIPPLPGSRINITEEDTLPASARAFVHPPAGMSAAIADDSEDDLGNISDLSGKIAPLQGLGESPPAGMDQNSVDGYTKMGGLEDLSGPEPSSPLESLSPLDTFTPLALDDEDAVSSAFGGSAAGADTVRNPPSSANAQAALPARVPDSVDVLPDLDSMAGAFLTDEGDEEPDTTEYSVSTPSAKPAQGKNASPWKGDFNAKDMAAGLRTVLNKEKEG